MQTQKEDVRHTILSASQRLFAEKGYRAATTREIADAAGVTLGNLYRYFPSKDSLFCTLVEPATEALERMLDEHHGLRGADIMQWDDERYYNSTVQEYIDIIGRYRVLLELLTLKAAGSSLEGYKELYVEMATNKVMKWIVRMHQEHPMMQGEVSEFFIYLNNVWLFTLIEEVLMHNLPDDETKLLLHDFIRFQFLGWKRMFTI